MIWLVEHPKTPTKNEEYDLVPGNRQLFGGTMWWNKIDVGVTVHRPNRDDKHDTSVMIKTWKVKRQQLNGKPGERLLQYDVRTNRYYPDMYFKDHPMLPVDLYKERDTVF
jgi:hypothetical protein